MKDNITRIYPKEQSISELKKDIAKATIWSWTETIKIHYHTLKMLYHEWRIRCINKKGVRLERKHEKRLDKINKRYDM